MRIPFLKPCLPILSEYAHLIDRIDELKLYSNYGPMITEFERKFLQYFFNGRGSLSSVSNATIGLMLAIQAVKRQGKYAIMPSFTFAATPLAAQWCGLKPLFVDIDADTWACNPQAIEDIISEYQNDIAVVVPYAPFGSCIDISFYINLMERGVPVVIDAAASVGSFNQDGSHFGSEFLGPVVFSLHATKAFGIGEGGIIYSADSELIERIRRMTNFGFGVDRVSHDLGLNAKLPEISGAVGLAALDDAQKKKKIKSNLVSFYMETIQKSALLSDNTTFFHATGDIPFQFFPLRMRDGLYNTDIVRALNTDDIEIRTYFSPACHQQKQFADAVKAELPITDALANTVLNLPLWEGMSEAQIIDICAALERAIQNLI